MPYTIVDNFGAGLDSRRHVLNSKPGTLAKIDNAHITRGGEIEKRKAFVRLHPVDVGYGSVYGLESTATGIYVFTPWPNMVIPSLPDDFHVMALLPPALNSQPISFGQDGSDLDENIENYDSPVMSTVFGGKIFAIMKHQGQGGHYCMAYYDGVVLKDWYEGVAPTVNFGSFAMCLEMVSYFSATLTPGYSAEAGYMSDMFNGSMQPPTPSNPAFMQDVDGFAPGDIAGGTRSFVITGKPGIDFTVEPIKTKQFTVEAIEVRKKVDYVKPTEATATLNIIAGAENPAQLYKVGRNFPGASVSIRSIRVNASSVTATDGTDILGWTSPTGLQYNTFPCPYTSGSNWGLLVYNIAKVINDNTTSGLAHKYKAASWRLYKNSGNDTNGLRIYAPADEGENANGWLVQIEFDADPSGLGNLQDLCDPASVAPSPYNPGKFIATMGTLSGGTTNQVVSIKVDGVEVLGSPIDWQESNGYTANLVKNQINTFSSSVEYAVSLTGSLLTFTGVAGQGALMNNKSIRVETIGNVIVTTSGTFNGGINAVQAVAKKVRVRYNDIVPYVGEPWGNKFGVTITGNDDPINPIVVGASRMADVFGKDPSFVFTYKSKVYVGFDSVVYFSALNDCTKWDIYDLGSGFIDMSNNFGGRERLTGCGVYQDKMVFFTSRSSQTWSMDPDPSLNRQYQTIENSGCVATDSIVSINSVDLIYLGDNGFRSLRARENTDSAYANDIGSAVDNLVIEHMQKLETDNPTDWTDPLSVMQYNWFIRKHSCRAVVEPVDGRLMMFLGKEVYVLSYFSGASISAWSKYKLHDSVECTGVTVFNNKVYFRVAPEDFLHSGQASFYVYGGLDSATYDSSPVDVEMPYLDAAKPATIKEVKGVDMTCEGQWQVYLGFDHTAPTIRDEIARLNQSTFAFGRIMATGYGTHLGPKFTSEAPGKAKIANFIVHFDERNSKHEAG